MDSKKRKRIQSSPRPAAVSSTPHRRRPDRPVVAFERFKLRNGLTVILHEDHSSPVAALVMMYRVGSKNERPGKTGLAHLFEHIMFKGSLHVGDGRHFALLQEIGAQVNGSTTEDRTNYYETVPGNELELAIVLEADRMGYLLPALNQRKLDNQRDVVMNERRQHYDNQPYGTAHERILQALYPEGHPYRWPVIGSMEDLSAATLRDARAFFKTYYAPGNAFAVIAGDINPEECRRWVREHFGHIPSGRRPPRPRATAVRLTADKRITFEDRVHLPRLYLTWPSVPGYCREDAVLDVLTDILAAGKSSRLHRALVVERQVAQSVIAYQYGMELAGMTSIEVTAKPDVPLSEIESAVWHLLEELLLGGVTAREIETSLNNKESQFVFRLTTALGKANSLATYAALAGDPNRFNKELDRFRGITPAEVRRHARRLFQSPKVILSVVPVGRPELAAVPPHRSPSSIRKAGKS